MNKKLLLTFIVIQILFVSTTYAQKKIDNIPTFDDKTWHWGYYLGLNLFDFKLTPNEEFGMISDTIGVAVNPGIGFSVGLLGDFRINKYLNLRIEPGVSLFSRQLIYNDSLKPVPTKEKEINIHSAYVTLPIFLKYGGKRRKNMRPYLIGGASMNFTFNSIQNKEGVDSGDKFEAGPLDLFLEAGGGIDWYLPFFKLSTEIRGAFGVNNILEGSKTTPYTEPIDRLQTRAIFFVLKFE